MTEKRDSEPYVVGYCKPPAQHQFKKGTSGNAKGRPRKKSREQETNTEMLLRILNEEHVISTGAKVTTREAIFRKLLTSIASKGNVKGILALLAIAPTLEAEPVDYRAEVRRKLNDLTMRLKDAQERGIDPSGMQGRET